MKYNCLMYHEIDDKGDKYSLKRHTFLEQLQFIKNQNIKAMSIRDFHKERIKDAIVLTFDDGFKSDVWAGEQLVEYEYTGTFFLVEDFIREGKNSYMDSSQVKVLANMGHEIGVHGKNHHSWPSKPLEELLLELSETKKWLEDLTGTEVSTCSAPGGKINNEIIKAIQESDLFKHIRNSTPWHSEFNSFEVNATAILQSDSSAVFQKKINGDAKYYHYLYAKNGVKKIVKPLIGK